MYLWKKFTLTQIVIFSFRYMKIEYCTRAIASKWGKIVVCQNAIVVLDVQDVWRAYGAPANVSAQMLQIFHFTSFQWTMN